MYIVEKLKAGSSTVTISASAMSSQAGKLILLCRALDWIIFFAVIWIECFWVEEQFVDDFLRPDRHKLLVVSHSSAQAMPTHHIG